MMSRKRSAPSFERALEDLEQIVEQLEQGDLSLDDSLRAYERGVALGRTCQQALDAAEQRIELLNGEGENARVQPFETDGQPVEDGDD